MSSTSNNEPLHDVSDHIQNLYEELPQHAPKDFKKSLKEVIQNSFNGKEAKNFSNYRNSLSVVCVWLIKQYPKHFVIEIFTTLVEIQEFSYATEEQRNQVSILQLQNVCFQHAMVLKLHIQGQLKSLTSCKFLGSYYHSFIKHAPKQHHIVSGRTSNTEKEEATFNSIKVATSLASNHHPNNVIANALIRLQAKDALNENQTTPERESKITKMYEFIKRNFKNTVISFHWIKKYKCQYQ